MRTLIVLGGACADFDFSVAAARLARCVGSVVTSSGRPSGRLEAFRSTLLLARVGVWAEVRFRKVPLKAPDASEEAEPLRELIAGG